MIGLSPGSWHSSRAATYAGRGISCVWRVVRRQILLVIRIFSILGLSLQGREATVYRGTAAAAYV